MRPAREAAAQATAARGGTSPRRRFSSSLLCSLSSPPRLSSPLPRSARVLPPPSLSLPSGSARATIRPVENGGRGGGREDAIADAPARRAGGRRRRPPPAGPLRQGVAAPRPGLQLRPRPGASLPAPSSGNRDRPAPPPAHQEIEIGRAVLTRLVSLPRRMGSAPGLICCGAATRWSASSASSPPTRPRRTSPPQTSSTYSYVRSPPSHSAPCTSP